jgi:hypothetical protein
LGDADVLAEDGGGGDGEPLLRVQKVEQTSQCRRDRENSVVYEGPR